MLDTSVDLDILFKLLFEPYAIYPDKLAAINLPVETWLGSPIPRFIMYAFNYLPLDLLNPNRLFTGLQQGGFLLNTVHTYGMQP